MKYKYEQLCFRVYRPFKCKEPGEVDDDTYLAYDRLVNKILKWLIWGRTHLLKSKAVVMQWWFFELNVGKPHTEKNGYS